MTDTNTTGADLRIGKYDIIDYLNNLTNDVLVNFSQGVQRDKMLLDLKRVKELVNNL